MVLNLRSNYPGQSIILITSNSNSQPFVLYSFCTPLICAWKKMIEFGCVAAGWHNMGSRAHHWSCDGGLFCTGKPTNCSQATTLVELKIRLFSYLPLVTAITCAILFCSLQWSIQAYFHQAPYLIGELLLLLFPNSLHMLVISYSKFYSCLISSQSGEPKQVKKQYKVWLGHIQLKAPVTVLPWSIFTSSNLTSRGILPKVIFHSQVPVSVTVRVRDRARNSGALHQLHSARNTFPPALIGFSVAAS